MDDTGNKTSAVSPGAVETAVKAYVLDEFLPGEDPASLTTDTPLITGGILDSIATVKLVAFLEEQYGVEFEAYEMGVDYLNTLSDIGDVVRGKLGSTA